MRHGRDPRSDGRIVVTVAAVIAAAVPVYSAPAATPPRNPCFVCHSSRTPGPSGGLFIDLGRYQESVHADNGCESCHLGFGEDPHLADLDQLDKNILTLAKNFERLGASRAVAVANVACVICHHDAYQDYLESVHAKALFEDKNKDAPTCIRCHGPAHYITYRRLGGSRVSREHLPETCGSCHANTTVVTTNRLNGHVLDTYRESLHGRKLLLGDSNAAVCISCHNNHKIVSPHDSAAFAENLHKACAECHEGATRRFADTFRHLPVDRTHQAVAYFVRLGFITLTTTTVFFLCLHILLDLSARLRGHLSQRRARHGA